MNQKHFRNSIWIALATNLVAGSIVSYAGTAEEVYYQNGLDAAQKKVSRQNNALHSASRLLLTTQSLQGHAYQVGDFWDVAAWNVEKPIMRKIRDPQKLLPETRFGGFFHYVVTAVSPQITVKVTEVASAEARPVDASISAMLLTFNTNGEQLDKAYTRRGQSELIHVSPEGLRSPMTKLEILPLDVPEVSSAERSTLTQLPEMPKPILDFAKRVGFKPNLANSVWLEQDDFFGRAVQMLWEKGSPWPSFMKTPMGIAILLRKGNS